MNPSHEDLHDEPRNEPTIEQLGERLSGLTDEQFDQFLAHVLEACKGDSQLQYVVYHLVCGLKVKE